MKDLKDLKDLTKKELNLFKIFIKDYKDPEDCLCDNFTCQCIDDLREITGLSNREIGGTLSSLETKGVIYLDERDGVVNESKNRITRMNFEPNLYWISDEFLESLPSDLDFERL